MSHDNNTNLVDELRVFLEERGMTHTDIQRDAKGAYVKEYLPANLQEII